MFRKTSKKSNNNKKNKTRKQKTLRRCGGKGQTIGKPASSDTNRRLTVLRTGITPATERRVSHLKKNTVTQKKSSWDTPKRVPVMKGGVSEFKSLLLKQLERLGVAIPNDYSKNTHDLYSNYGIYANLANQRVRNPLLDHPDYYHWSPNLRKGIAWLRAVNDCENIGNICTKHIPTAPTVSPDAEASRRSVAAAIALNSLPATDSDAEDAYYREWIDREDEEAMASDEERADDPYDG